MWRADYCIVVALTQDIGVLLWTGKSTNHDGHWFNCGLD